MAQYSTDENLTARIALQTRGVNPTPWPRWYWSAVDAGAADEILDVGCGNGFLWTAGSPTVRQGTRVTLVDASPGMIDATRSKIGAIGGSSELLVARVEALPFGDDSFDLVMANHMLYHSDDVHQAIAEIARVVRPGGTVAASTNGRDHMRQLRQWVSDVGLESAIGVARPGAICGLGVLEDHVDRFGLENGPRLLGEAFAVVELQRQEDWIRTEDPGLVLNYVRSLELPESDQVEAAMDRLRERLEYEVATRGYIRIDKESGVFVCTDPKGRSA